MEPAGGRFGLGTIILERPFLGAMLTGWCGAGLPAPLLGAPSVPWPSRIGGEVCACSVLCDKQLWAVPASRHFSLFWCSTLE